MKFVFKLLLFTILSSFLIFGGEGKALSMEKRSTKKWTGYVANGLTCGIHGRDMTGFTIGFPLEDDANSYRVHIKGRGWLPPVIYSDTSDFDNGYAGTKAGDPIDGIAIYGTKRYRVHTKGGRWLPWVTGYNINDSRNGYAGNLGSTIDLIQVEGSRVYACAYNI